MQSISKLNFFDLSQNTFWGLLIRWKELICWSLRLPLLAYLQILHSIRTDPAGSGPNQDTIKSDRIWADGCYDMVHFGHANSFRQARALGRHLTVGVHSDEEIRKHKGTPPVFTETERYELVRAIKWVDDVVEAAPYVTTLETLDAHGCRFCAHGDDITTTIDGSDTYQEVKDAGRFREYDRTQGVSTTDLIERMLRTWEIRQSISEDLSDTQKLKGGRTQIKKPEETLALTTQKIVQLAEGNRPPSDQDRIVYVAGAFDVLHLGHIRFLQKARELGTYLIVGVYDDPTVTLTHGPGFPLMSLNERVLALLSCKYVSDVLIGAPLYVPGKLLEQFRVHVVALSVRYHPLEIYQELYEEAVEKNIFQMIDTGSSLTTLELVQRVGKSANAYAERNRKKKQKEASQITKHG